MRRRCWPCCGACGRRRKRRLPRPRRASHPSPLGRTETGHRFLHAAGFAVFARPRHPLRHAGAAGRRTGTGAGQRHRCRDLAAPSWFRCWAAARTKRAAVLAALGWRSVEVADAPSRCGARAKEKRAAAPSRQAEEARAAARSQFALCRPCGAALAMSRRRAWTNGCSMPASIAPGRWPRPPPAPARCG